MIHSHSALAPVEPAALAPVEPATAPLMLSAPAFRELESEELVNSGLPHWTTTQVVQPSAARKLGAGRLLLRSKGISRHPPPNENARITRVSARIAIPPPRQLVQAIGSCGAIKSPGLRVDCCRTPMVLEDPRDEGKEYPVALVGDRQNIIILAKRNLSGLNKSGPEHGHVQCARHIDIDIPCIKIPLPDRVRTRRRIPILRPKQSHEALTK
eukprot:scaffold6008_cov118-Isochrysis_galbana.AAC.3